MSFFDAQNPGISVTNELTLAELALVQSLTALGDPGADRLLFWDESSNAFAYLTVGSGLTITDTTITASASGVSGTANEIAYFDTTTSIASLPVATYPSLTELAYLKGVTSAIQTQLNAKQASLGFTAENVANKATDFTTINNTLYPTVEAVNNAINTAVVGLLDYRGSYDASVNTFPATGGSGLAGAILKGDFWVASVGGTLGGTVVTVGDLIIALQDTPAQTASNWDLISNELGYTPENVANKENTTLDTSTTKYPTNRLAKEYADGKVEDSITDGHTTVAPSGNAVFDALALKAPLSSPTFTGTVTLADNARIDLTLPTADTYVTGNTTDSFAAGYSSSVGDLVFFGSGGKWLEVDSNAVATCQGLIGIALEAKTDTQAMKVALPGSFVRLDSWNWTVGATLYAGETLGAMQETIPTGADAVVKVVGFAVSSDVIFFQPSSDQQTVVA